MAFWGCSFIFDDIPCEEFDLMMYDIGSSSNNTGKFATGATIVEDKVSSRWKPFFYGTKYEDKLKVQLTFGVNTDRIEKQQHFTRQEMEEIAFWLTGHREYKWLSIMQDDMALIRYHCIVTSLETVEFGLEPYAMKATFECDGPYAYLPERDFVYTINNATNIQVNNISGHRGYFMPVFNMVFSGSGRRSLTIVNHSDGDRTTQFSDIPSGAASMRIDSDRQIITIENVGSNPYQYMASPFNFPRLVNGINDLTVTGNGTLHVICAFPKNVGA